MEFLPTNTYNKNRYIWSN